MAIDWGVRGISRHEVDEAVAILLRMRRPPQERKANNEYQLWDLNDMQGLIWDQPDLPPLNRIVIQTIAEADEGGLSMEQLEDRMLSRRLNLTSSGVDLDRVVEDLLEPSGPLRRRGARVRIGVGLFRRWCLAHPLDSGVLLNGRVSQVRARD